MTYVNCHLSIFSFVHQNLVLPFASTASRVLHIFSSVWLWGRLEPVTQQSGFRASNRPLAGLAIGAHGKELSSYQLPASASQASWKLWELY